MANEYELVKEEGPRKGARPIRITVAYVPDTEAVERGIRFLLHPEREEDGRRILRKGLIQSSGERGDG